MTAQYIALGSLIVAVLGFLVLVVKSTSNKDLIMSVRDSNKEMIDSLKEAIKEIKDAIVASAEKQVQNHFDFKSHQEQAQRTHDTLTKVEQDVKDLGIEVRGYHTEIEVVKKDISEIKTNTIHCKKVSFNG